MEVLSLIESHVMQFQACLSAQPPWWQQGVIYQVYLRGFQDSNGDGIGDLAGVIQRLDYLSEVLGVDALWLSPFYPSPMADGGYDVADYLSVDPLFGDLATFDRLLKEAHARLACHSRLCAQSYLGPASLVSGVASFTPQSAKGLVYLGRLTVEWLSSQQLAQCIWWPSLELGSNTQAVLPAFLPSPTAGSQLASS